MSSQPSASASGQFKIGDIEVNRLGFGAMRITGAGIWGDPADPKAARETLKRLPQLGINLIDTADSYGPYVSEDLIKEILHPYKGLLIATKGGLTRHGPNIWAPVGRPEYLRQCVLMSLRRLGVERIDLWQLHRVDPKVPRDEQFDAIAAMREEGLIRHAGLSEVGVDDIEAAQKYFPVVTVQNQYNLVDRKSEAVLDYCDTHGIGFIPWAPARFWRSDQVRCVTREDRRHPQGGTRSGSAGLDPQALQSHAADSGHRKRGSSRREYGRSRRHLVERRVRDPGSRRPCRRYVMIVGCR